MFINCVASEAYNKLALMGGAPGKMLARASSDRQIDRTTRETVELVELSPLFPP